MRGRQGRQCRWRNSDSTPDGIATERKGGITLHEILMLALPVALAACANAAEQVPPREGMAKAERPDVKVGDR